jgi:hypothetical protein
VVLAFWPVPPWATILVAPSWCHRCGPHPPRWLGHCLAARLGWPLGMDGSESGHYADGDLPAPMTPTYPGVELTEGTNFLI